MDRLCLCCYSLLQINRALQLDHLSPIFLMPPEMTVFFSLSSVANLQTGLSSEGRAQPSEGRNRSFEKIPHVKGGAE